MAGAQQTRPRRSPRTHRTETPPPPPPPTALTELILVRRSTRGQNPLLYRGHFRLTYYRGAWYAAPICPIYPIIGEDDEYSGEFGPPSVDSD